jgi:uncharacterized protein YggE
MRPQPPACLLLLAVTVIPAAAQTSDTQSLSSVIVSTGTAVVRRAPERAFVTIATETLAPTPSDAQQKNAQAMSAVRQKLTSLRLPADAVRTSSYSLNQEFELTNNRREPRGFRAINAVEVRVDEISRTGEIIDAVVQAGAATINGIRFDLKDRDAAEREALTQAVADARARADAIAAGAKVTVTKVVRIDEQGSATPPQPMFRQAAMVAAADTPVTGGDIEITATVTLTAAFAPGQP